MPEPTLPETALEDVLLIQPVPIVDERGFFVRTMSAEPLLKAGIDVRASVHENQGFGQALGRFPDPCPLAATEDHDPHLAGGRAFVHEVSCHHWLASSRHGGAASSIPILVHVGRRHPAGGRIVPVPRWDPTS